MLGLAGFAVTVRSAFAGPPAQHEINGALYTEPQIAELNSRLGGCGWSKCTHCVGGDCGPAHPECIASKNKPVYTFHLADPTCDINDPNGPMYDPVHKMYHNFYQIHEAMPMAGAGDGPDWGHWVSKDFVKWAQLPVAIWNDQYYDNSAIYTGSTTIVDGKPVIMYPGKCKGKCNGGKGGFTYDLVVPENPDDPLYTNWTKKGNIAGKPFFNPVVNGTGDDPSTAWRTEHGEWRIIGNQNCQKMYGSMDFVEWYEIGCTTLMPGDCPTFFPLPKLTPGSEQYVTSHGPLPDHVHKSGGHGGDQVQVGRWTEGKPGPAGTGTVGTWVQTPGSSSVLLDKGKTHASKDFHDPVKNRQILWVWGTVTSGIQTVPREMTYHPGIKQIVYSPVEEMLSLRAAKLGSLQSTPLKPGKSVSIKVSDASEVVLYFTMPAKETSFDVAVGAGSFFINVNPPSATGPTFSSVGFNTSKFAQTENGETAEGYADRVPLLAEDHSIIMRIYLDGSVAECYWMDGRVAMTVPTTVASSATISVTADSQLLNATSYTIDDIHTTVDALMMQHHAM